MQPASLSATSVAVAAILGYLLGSVPFGYLAGKTRGVDIRKHGSGAIGATNTLRVFGAGLAIVVALLDVSKGLVAALLGRYVTGDPFWGVAIGGAAVITGHSWSIFLGFKGGKSVAASSGVLLFFMPALGAAAVVVFLVLVVATRYVSLGSMAGAAVAAVLGLFWPGLPLPYRLFLVYAAAIILYRHQSNLRRLLAGTESKFGQRVDPGSGTGAETGTSKGAKGGHQGD